MSNYLKQYATVKDFLCGHSDDFNLSICILDTDGYGICCRKFANNEFVAKSIISEYGDCNILKIEYGIFDDATYYLSTDYNSLTV